MNSRGANTPNMSGLFRNVRLQRGLAFGVIIITALLAFEIFNYSTTDFALRDLLGDLTFLGVRWATILAIAFCGIDFAGIARLFTPEQGGNDQGEIWYLFGAWLLAATMNAMLTWWGVSLAILNHETLGNSVIARDTLLRAVPIFVAVLVWLIRVLIIGTFSVAGERMFTQAEVRTQSTVYRPGFTVPLSPTAPAPAPTRSLSGGSRAPAQRPVGASARTPYQPAPKASASEYLHQETAAWDETPRSESTRPEPTYHPVSASPATQSASAAGRGAHSRSLNNSPRR